MLMNAGNGVIIVSTHHRMEHVETLLAHSYVAVTLDILEMVLRRAKVPTELIFKYSRVKTQGFSYRFYTFSKCNFIIYSTN
jgi:hypothetical protein